MILYRYESAKTYTRGVLIVGDLLLHTIERSWLENRRGISCIPSGVYDYDFLKRSASGKYRNVFHIKNVRSRSGILMHNGNLASHSRGCIIIGSKRGVLGGKAAVLSSRKAMRRLVKVAGKKSGKITIIGGDK